ncbi:MAG: 50S ribosome-binding GTPase, partial [Muribaculaceae bacterium]|nr:50S ribosome-binding GTPase [Muribaculaceae bacterium]
MELKNKEMMNTTNDTICAISTPHGSGGIAVARVSGPDAIQITDKIWKGKTLATVASHTAHLREVLDSKGDILDQAVATVFKSPSSYTSEDTVEISVHGSRWIQRELINSLINAGARLAGRGEFTSRAFAAGRFDLAEAEAVADLIASSSRAAHRIAINQMRGSISRRLDTLRQSLIELASLLELELDFSEEDVEFASRERLLNLASETKAEIERLVGSFNTGAAIKDGIPVAIIGKTNAGKSSLLNALIGDDRAIVSDIHGTTRDIVEDTIEIGDYLVRFQDTAG